MEVSPDKKIEDTKIDDKEAARLTKNVLSSVCFEALCCSFTGIPFFIWSLASVPDLISRGRYGSALWDFSLYFGLLAALLSKLYLGLCGVRASNPKQLRWYSRMSYCSLIPFGCCVWQLFVLGFIAIAMAHGGREPTTRQKYTNFFFASLPCLLMLLLTSCQLLGAPAADTLSRHVNMQPPPCPPVVPTDPVGKAEGPSRDDCSTEPSHTGAQVCGQCGDGEEIV